MPALLRPILRGVLALLVASAGVACGGGGSSGASSACPAPAGGAPAGWVPVQGGIAGASVAGQLCSSGAFAVLQSTAGADLPPTPFVFNLETSAVSAAVAHDYYVTFQNPGSALGGTASANVGLVAARPGTFRSSDGACGHVQVCAFFPSTGAACPAAATCSGGLLPSQCYEALGPTDCDDSRSTQTPKGSWTLTLTSVAPSVVNGVTSLDQSIHGSMAATLVGSDPSLGEASLTATF